MKPSSRNKLRNYGLPRLHNAAENSGLWFDRYLEAQPEKEANDTLSPYEQLIRACQEIAEKKAPLYEAAFARWQDVLSGLGVQPRVMRTTYRLAAGHGRESVIESGIALHHAYGVPFVPGSSLKGMASSFAVRELAEWGAQSYAHQQMFGTTKLAGYVTFYDALPLPGRWKLLPDTIAVSHRDYYQAGKPPGDWEDTIPIPFPSAMGDFLIAVRAADPAANTWAEAAYEILEMALGEDGAGGKTSSGYGRMEPTE